MKIAATLLGAFLLAGCAAHKRPAPVPPAATPAPCVTAYPLPAEFLERCDSCVVVAGALPPCPATPY